MQRLGQVNSSSTASSSNWLRSRQMQMNCMFTRTAALIRRSFCDETQVLICMCLPRMNSVSRAPSPVLRWSSGWSAKSSMTTSTWNSFFSPSCLEVLVIFFCCSIIVLSAPSSHLSKYTCSRSVFTPISFSMNSLTGLQPSSISMLGEKM